MVLLLVCFCVMSFSLHITLNNVFSSGSVSEGLGFGFGIVRELPKICIRIGILMHRIFHFYFVDAFF